jgi:spore cortex formation protein SpoVR/YcgB (stage V sporulation)
MSEVTAANRTPLFTDADWDFAMLDRVYDAIREIAEQDLGLDTYPNQVEIISSEQMLDAYSSHAMPLMYRHWSFGKIFARQEVLYRKGYTALAYEIVINSSPCISYLMEENTMTMQALVIAHAAFGHNHFFKNNYLFRQWTDAGSILDYLNFAKKFISACEERYGIEAVELTLDSATAARPGLPPRLCRSAGARVSNMTSRPSPTSGAPCRLKKMAPPAATKMRRSPSPATSRCPKRTSSISWKKRAPSSKPGSASFCASCATSRNISILKSRPR